MNYVLRLTYFPVRARGEPILLLLADSGISYKLEEISTATWLQLKRTHQISNDQFPYSMVPVLHAKCKSEIGGEKEVVLGETSAILSFLDDVLAPPGDTVGPHFSRLVKYPDGRSRWAEALK